MIKKIIDQSINLLSWQKFPFQPGWHPVSHTPFTLSQPVHVLLHTMAQFCPKYPYGQSEIIIRKCFSVYSWVEKIKKKWNQ